MPLERAPLAKWCTGPASLCEAVKLDCTKCNSTNKEMAEIRRDNEQGNEVKK